MAEENEKEKITGETSDGYHTFNELYDHRCLLWINYCLLNQDKCYLIPNHFDGWFLLGMKTSWGQISYHCPNKFYGVVENVKIEKPEYDGHTSKEVLERLMSLAVFNRDSRPPVQKLDQGELLKFSHQYYIEDGKSVYGKGCYFDIPNFIKGICAKFGGQKALSVKNIYDIIENFWPHAPTFTRTEYKMQLATKIHQAQTGEGQ